MVANRSGGSGKRTPPKLDEFLLKRDYTGALAFLKFTQEALEADETNPEQISKENLQQFDQWKAFLHFHLGDYQKALEQYQKLITTIMADNSLKDNKKEMDDIKLNVAICMFYLGLYEEAQQTSLEVGKLESGKSLLSSLQQRLDYHLAFKLNDDESNTALEMEEKLGNSIEDRLSLASMHYMRAHYQDAIEIYKKLLREHKYDIPAIPIK